MTATTTQRRTPNTEVQEGDVVIVRGAQYRITDEPAYVRTQGHLMLRWTLRPVPAGPATGLLSGIWDVWPAEDVNVVEG